MFHKKFTASAKDAKDPLKKTETADGFGTGLLWESFEKEKKHFVFWTLPRTLDRNPILQKKLARGCARIANMPGGMDSTGLAVGLKKGFIVEKRKLPVKPSTRKGVRALASPPVPGLHANKPYLSRCALCAVRARSWGVRAEAEQLAALKCHRCRIL